MKSSGKILQNMNINELSDKYHGIYLTINKLKNF